MKRTLSLILAALLLSSSLLACSESGTGEETQTDGTTAETPAADESETPAEETETETETEIVETEPEITDDLPEVTYNGEEYMIYNTNSEGNTWFTTVHIDFEEDSAEVITSAVYQRNRLVEDRFDIKIVEVNESASEVTSLITAGDQSIDLLLLEGTDTMTYINSGHLYNLYDLENLDFEKPYWDQNAQEYLTISGKYFEAVGNFMTTHIDESICTYFNKSIIDDYHLENPYELVDSFKWTYDKLYEMGKTVLSDLDGNGEYNDRDRYGLVSARHTMYPYLIYGSGETYISKDESDLPYISFYNDRFLSVYEKVCDIAHSEGDTFTYDAGMKKTTLGLDTDHAAAEVIFEDSRALFWIDIVGSARTLREMDADFGIIPAPMYTEDQGQYYNLCGGNFYGQCVPVTITGDALEFTTIIMEALNSMSASVLDAFYEVSVKSRDSRDEESGRMLDLIFTNRIYDISLTYDLAAVNDAIYTRASENTRDISSYYNSQQKAMTKIIDRMVKKVVES